MNLRREVLVIVLALTTLVFIGCGGGGGGGGGGGPVGPAPATAVTINGTVSSPEVNDGLLASFRAKAGNQIDFSVLTIQVEGDDTSKVQLSGTGSATFKISLATLASSSLKLVVKNKAGKVLLARALYGLANGDTKVTTVDATSTAIVTLMAANPAYAATDIEAQTALAPFQAILTALQAALKNATSSSPLDDAGVQAAVTAAKTSVRPGESEIKAEYAAMKQALENNTLTDQERLDAFMSSISPQFKDIAGTASFNDLRTTTGSRLERYTINAYSFTIQGLKYTATDTVEVTTATYIDVTRKPGAAGGVAGAKINVTPVPKVIWKYNGTKWLIMQGLPYKQSEINI